ncbi:MAG TPA: DUF4331 family protein [Chitinophagaceae bacterium]|jgi:hypothetical protein|nr:DUF4331 family protein [Chitinophagaceae bacterium]
MKKKILTTLIGCMALVAGIIYAADHIDAPGVTGPGGTSMGNDLTDIYAFQNPSDNSKMVLVCNVQGLMSPTATASAKFANNTMYEMNIDNTGDNVEDLVIQFLVQNNKVRAYGPFTPLSTGMASTVKADAVYTETTVTPYGTAPIVGTNTNGIKIFAGPRDDPFFFDLARFKEILGGTQTGFRNPGVDAFAGTNVMSLVIELPKSMLGTGASINYWCETKTK